MGFSRQEYWSGLPFPSPGDLPDPGIEPTSPTWQADALTSEPPGKPFLYICIWLCHVDKYSVLVTGHVWEMVFYWKILPPWESFQNMSWDLVVKTLSLHFRECWLIPAQGTKVSHAAQNGQKTKTENPKNQCLSWHFTQTTEALLLPTENSLLHSSDFLGYYRMVPACFMTSQKVTSILFYLWKCRLQPQASTVHSLNSQWLSFHVWASLHPHLPQSIVRCDQWL